jgi:hypothetical protein
MGVSAYSTFIGQTPSPLRGRKAADMQPIFVDRDIPHSISIDPKFLAKR